ncbi:MAG: ribosome maturation factor RimP [Atopobiaceae bacterium]|nr:ribosome maturation factor RimP [Atopobiaceae bacterium]
MAQASFDDIRATVLQGLEALAANYGVDIVDVEVVGSPNAPTVRVRIDHAEESAPPISLDEVSEHTAWISDYLDEADPIAGHFTLEVSSPGMARPLRKARDFERFAGNDVSLSLKTTQGRRRYTGRLDGYEDGMARITTDEGTFSFKLEDIRTCTIKPDFDADKGIKGARRKGSR